MPRSISKTPHFLQFPSGAAFQESLAYHLCLLPFCLMNILVHLLQKPGLDLPLSVPLTISVWTGDVSWLISPCIFSRLYFFSHSYNDQVLLLFPPGDSFLLVGVRLKISNLSSCRCFKAGLTASLILLSPDWACSVWYLGWYYQSY